jgi:hypothetical protein
MKAIAQTARGSPDFLELEEIDEPLAQEGGVPVRIQFRRHACMRRMWTDKCRSTLPA